MTKLDVDAFTQILDKFNVEPKCEHSDHDKDQLVHHGPAEWHVSTKCPGCGQSDRKLMCQGWYEFASSPHAPESSPRGVQHTADRSRVLCEQHMGEAMKPAHAKKIREGILLARDGRIDEGLRLRGIGWKAFYRTKTKTPHPLYSTIWPKAQTIISNRESLFDRLSQHD